MSPQRIVPQGEDLRRAIRWLSAHGDYSSRAIEDACRQFDLSPVDEEYLLRHFARRNTDDDS